MSPVLANLNSDQIEIPTEQRVQIKKLLMMKTCHQDAKGPEAYYDKIP